MKSVILFIAAGFLAMVFYQSLNVHANTSTRSHQPNNIATPKEVPEEVDVFLEPPSLPLYRIRPREKSIQEKVQNFINGGSTYPHAKAINNVARLEDRFIRQVRNKIDPRHSGQELNLGLALDLYDHLHDNRIYINDPLGQPYFSTPLMYWLDHTGDHIDESLCLAVALGAVGCHSRVVFAQSESAEEIVYVELYMGTQEEELRKYVDYIHARYSEANQQEISFYSDRRGDIWLNLQVSNPYPGYLSSDGDGTPQHILYPLLQNWYDRN